MSGVAHAALAIALLAGGSGEPDAKSNFFLRDLSDFKQALAARGWKVSVVAGAGSSRLAAKAATNAELAAASAQTLKAAQAGDEVLLLYHSHGIRQRADWGQKSHSITSEDEDSSGNAPAFDLDRIEPALKEAEARGVKTALVDLSCYSGATLSLQGPTCTVTLASKKYISLCSGRPEERLFASRFFKLPPPGGKVSLEAQFLQARRADLDSINLPQISSRKTPAVDAWDDFLETVDPLDVYEDLQNLRTGAKPFQPKMLVAALKGASDSFAEKLKQVVALRARLEAAMPTLADDYDKEELAFDLPSGAKLKLSPASLADLLDAASSGKIPEEWDDTQRRRVGEVRTSVGALAERFKKEVTAFRERRKEFDELTAKLERGAGELMSLERGIYDQSAEPSGDGCSEFFL
jgi:hypothetical protein